MLGKTVKDKVTGFHGIATAIVKYLNGCTQVCIKPKVGPDGKMVEGEYIDINQVEVIGEGLEIQPKDTGGPMMDTPKG